MEIQNSAQELTVGAAHGTPAGETPETPAETPRILLDYYLKTLRLPTFSREYDKVAGQCAQQSADYPRYPQRPLPGYQKLGQL